MSRSEKRELLARLLAKQQAPSSIYPLSHGQRALWSLHEAFPESAAYNVAFAARLDAQANGRLLREAFQFLINRHPSLRTRIVSTGGDPRQHVEPHGTIDHVELDVRGWDARAVREHLEREVRRPFQLDRAPLLRTERLAGDPRGDVLLVVLHHAAGDFWSLGVLLDELRVVWDALRAGATPALPPIGSSYGDFVRWQGELVSGIEGDRLWKYWKDQLADAVPVLDLPCDGRRPATQTFAGREHHFTLTRTVNEPLHQLARASSVTLYVVLLAGFSTLLQRYSGQSSILIGMPVSGRTRPEFAPVVGYFVNLVPVRASFEGDPTFRELVGRLRETVAGAMAHQDFPFPALVDRLECERDPARSPLVQAVLNMPRAHRLQGRSALPFEPTADGISLRLGDVTLEQFPIDQGTSVFEISLTVLETADGGLNLTFQYNSDLFEADTIDRMARQYATLLRDAADRPDTRVSSLNLEPLSQPNVASGFSRTDNVFAATRRCVSELIDEQCRTRPDETAVVDDVEAVTYAGLAERRDAVARALLSRGVSDGALVGLWMAPGADLIGAMLGVLRAGAAYVPLDPAYPPARIAHILREAGVRLVIAGADVDPAISPDVPIVRVRDCAARGGRSTPDAFPIADPDSLAYVIFTSGSTGLPKGVAVSRRNLLYSTAARTEYYAESPSGFLLLSSPAFDSSVAGIFWTLAAGGTLSLGRRVPPSSIDPAAVLADMHARRITHTLCVPSLYGALLDEIAARPPAALAVVIVAGEPCPQSLVDRHYQILPDVALFNEYGPTEATVWSTVYRCRAGQPRAHAPIGAAIPGSRVYLLDTNLRPVPAGVAGEIFVAGPGVARGYLHRPDLTAEAFLPDPFVDRGAGRMYRTGDRARCRNGRDFEFLGRLDEQLKIRGWRIEPAEIAAALREHPGVRDAVVCRVEQPSGAPALAAYVDSDGVASAGLPDERIRQWHAVYDHSYGRPDTYAPSDPAINLAVWTSSYTRAPLPESDILSSVDAVSSRILALRPRRILEIGCGTGLLLARLAPHCQDYLGYDFSEPALARAREMARGRGFSHVRLACRNAHEIAGAGEFDAVVLNEVVQHFPGIDYLHRVLERAVRLLGDRGFVFLGGIRHLALLEAFHGSVELERAAAPMTRARLRQRTERQIARENELFVHPQFFAGLPALMPEVAGVAIEVKRGRAHNEITRFKFDAICHVGRAPEAAAAGDLLDWHTAPLDPTTLTARLAAAPSRLVVQGIPNGRLTRELRTIEWLHGGGLARTAGDVRSRRDDGPGVDPEDIAAIGEQVGYSAGLHWSSNPWQFDAVFARTPAPTYISHGTHHAPALASDPLRPARAAALVAELRASLRERLPAPMVPAYFVVMPALPRGPNGKLDRRALPLPDDLSCDDAGGAAAPRNEAERTLARIWGDVLGLKDVGVHDSFFALGGDSILVIQMVGRARKAGIRITPRDVFERETIERLAAPATRAGEGPASMPAVPGAVPLTPIQHWFFEHPPARPAECCQGVVLQPAAALSPPALEAALRAVMRQHDALRLGFRQAGTSWVQHLDDHAGRVPLRCVSGVSDALIEQELSAALASMNLETPPLCRAILFDEGPAGPGRLLLLAHHLVIDAVSWSILLDDLSTAIEQIAQGQAVAFAADGVPFSTWARELEHRAESPAILEELEYWELADAAMTPLPLEAAADTGEIETLVATLSREDTSLLTSSAGRANPAAIERRLLCSLANAIVAWTGPRRVLIDLERHGRDDREIDLSRTVGWLTAIVPIALDLRDADGPPSIDREVARQLRSIRHGGVGAGLLGYRSRRDDERDRDRAAVPHAEIILNYLGEVDRLLEGGVAFRLAPETTLLRSRIVPPGRYPLSLDVYAADGQLRAEWTFRTARVTRARVEQLAADFLAALRLAGAASGPAHDRPVPEDDRADAYGLSPVQQGLLFHSISERHSRAYVGQLACRLDGPVNADALEEAWAATVQRHPVLRTSFEWDSVAEPVQRVHSHVAVRVDRQEARALHDDENTAIEMFLAADRARGFAVEAVPLTRLALLRVDADRHWIVWSHHHVILDGWSIPIVLADLFAHYRAALAHTRVASPPPRPYRDYISWLDRQDPGRARDFWQRTFAGWSGALFAGRNPSGASEDRGEATRAIACGDLVALSRRLRLTLNTLVQGAWALVLGRRAGSRDVVFGVTSAGRPYDLDGADRMVGPFISTLPFRATLSAGQRVDTWLRGVQERQVEMRQFEYCPLADVQSWTGARGRGQLFEALIVFENYPVDALLTAELGTFGVSDVRFTAWNHYALTLRVVPRPDRLLLTLLHDRATVPDTQAAGILQDLEAALAAIARSGDGDLGSLEQMIVWASPSPEEIEAGARHSAEAMLSASRRRVVQS